MPANKILLLRDRLLHLPIKYYFYPFYSLLQMKKLLFAVLFTPLIAGAQTNADSLKNIGSIKYYTKAISQEPNNADYYHKRGAAYLNLDNFKDALNDLNKSISIDIKTEETFFDRGRTYYALKDYDKAIIDHTRAIALKKGNTDAFL
jgi:tetratricopeptide (TPR) repeat protein